MAYYREQDYVGSRRKRSFRRDYVPWDIYYGYGSTAARNQRKSENYMKTVQVQVPNNYHVEVKPDIIKEKQDYENKLVSASRGYDNKGNLVSSPENFRKKGARFNYYE